MTRSELVARLSRRNPHLRAGDLEKAVDAVFAAIAGALAAGKRVELRGFGVFHTRQRRARTGRNPKTGARVSVNRKTVPLFRTGKLLHDLLNSNPAGSS
ncbi:MAG: integration host factor subunit beta [Pseudomonadota bacterium]|nr:integration host factor subunit beta [Pseudomonadota bacterium]